MIKIRIPRFYFSPIPCKRSLALSLSLLITFASQLPSYCWFDFGHMEVACVAYRRMSSKARSRAMDLLKLNPAYSKWVASVPSDTRPDDREKMIFIQAATWPDVIKGDPAYQPDGSNHGHRADSPEAGRNIGYSDHLLHKYWHFTDTPLTSDGTPLPALDRYTAATQIKTFRQAIGSDCSEEVKSYDLVWLIHLVGDVHQPLHCAMRVSHSDTEGDAGGNKVKLFCEQGGMDNLHSYWDALPGTDRKPDNVPEAVRQLHPADPKLTAKMDTDEWITESYRYAIKDVYVSPVKNGDGPFRITSKYRRRAEALCKKRIELAGERLAKILNSELK